MPDLFLWYWMATVSFGRQGMLTCWRISIITVLQLDRFCRKQEKWVEVPYVLLFISLWDMPDLCPKAADVDVDEDEIFSCLLFSYLAPVSRAPNWTGWESGHPSRRSVSIEIWTVPIVVKTIKRIQKVHGSLYGTNFILWAYLERRNVCLGTDADSWL